MLLHLCPKLHWPYNNPVRLTELVIEPFGFTIAAGNLLTGRVFRNRAYKVACRETQHKKAFNGLLVDVPKVDEFETTARWSARMDETQEIHFLHRVHHRILDHDFDMVSEHKLLWHGFHNGQWTNRFPEGWVVRRDPIMEITPVLPQGPETWDTISDGWIVNRVQVCDMPTIERERLQEFDRMPRLENAFVLR